MATIKQIFGSNIVLNVTGLDSLVDAGIAVSDEVDNSVDLDMNVDISVNINGSGDTIDMYMTRVNATGDYPSTDELANLLFIGSVVVGASTPKKTYRVEQLPKFYKLVFVNSSGFATTSAVINLMSANLTN